MKHLFIPYNLALIAQEKMFLDKCLAYYVEATLKICKDGITPVKQVDFISFNHSTKYCVAPLYQQIIDWFREKHNLEVTIRKMWKYSNNYKPQDTFYRTTVTNFTINRNDEYILFISDGDIQNYYEALDKAIKEAFKLI